MEDDCIEASLHLKTAVKTKTDPMGNRSKALSKLDLPCDEATCS